MQTKQNDMNPGDAQAALAWLIEMGADEIVGEAPVNRFAWWLPRLLLRHPSPRLHLPGPPLHRQKPAIRWKNFRRPCSRWKISR